MASLEPELLRAVSPVRSRLLLHHFSRWALYAAAAALATAAAIFLTGSFLPKYEANRMAASGAAGVACLVLAAAAWRRPQLPDIARRADGAGLSERLITCLEYAGQQSVLLDALRADTVAALQAADWRRHLPWRTPRGALLAGAVCTALILAVNFIPNPVLQRMLQAQAEREAIAAQAERLDAAMRLAEAEAEKLAKGEEAAEILAQLRDDLKQARTAREALQALGRAEDNLDQLLQPEDADLGQKLQEAGQALMQSPDTSPLGEALAQRDWEGARQQLEQLAAELNSQTPEERQAAAGALERASDLLQQAEQIVGGEQASIARELARAAGALREEELQGAASALREAGEAVLNQGQAANEAALLGEEVADLLSELSAAREALAVAAAGGADGEGEYDRQGLAVLEGAAAPAESANEGISGAGGGAMEGEGQVLGSSVGGREGNDGGEGGQVSSNVGGSGAGRMDSGPATQGSQVGAAGPSGSGEIRDARREYSQVFDPAERLGGDGKGSLLQGQSTGDGGATQFQSPEAQVSAGQFRPYDEVFAEYEEQAIHSMQRVELPPGVQQLVKSYFSALDPANTGSGGTR